MEMNDADDEEFGFSRNYFLAKELGGSAVKSHSKLSDINIVDEQVLTSLAEVLWDQLKTKRRTPSKSLSKNQQPFSSRSVEDLLAFLDGSEDGTSEFLVCVIIHNIDGPGLRDSETQQCLARVASCPNTHLVASIDHLNAPLLWDKKMVHTQFNWCHHVPTFAPFKIEGTFFPLILAHGNTTQTAKDAVIVVQS